MKPPLRNHSETSKERARELRKNLTEPERALWKQLRDAQLGFRFRRQHNLGEFVLDFYCPALRLAIEVDGSSHHDRQGYDAMRDAYVERQGIRVVRVWNMEIRDPFGEAMIKIQEAIALRRTELGI
jgi:very-short-patch-repair endonuclease